MNELSQLGEEAAQDAQEDHLVLVASPVVGQQREQRLRLREGGEKHVLFALAIQYTSKYGQFESKFENSAVL